jgi:hypothetical protein
VVWGVAAMTLSAALTLPAVPSELPIRLSVGRSALADVFAEAGFTKGAEIGVWEGDFAEKLFLANPRQHLICVDPWRPQKGYLEVKNDVARLEAAFATAQQRLQKFDCTFMRMTSLDAAAQVPDGSLDFAYIDGNHLMKHVLADLAAWTPKVRAGGIIAGHDYKLSPKKPFIQVKQAVDEYTTAHTINPWFVLAGDKSPSYFWVKA